MWIETVPAETYQIFLEVPYCDAIANLAGVADSNDFLEGLARLALGLLLLIPLLNILISFLIRWGNECARRAESLERIKDLTPKLRTACVNSAVLGQEGWATEGDLKSFIENATGALNTLLAQMGLKQAAFSLTTRKVGTYQEHTHITLGSSLSVPGAGGAYLELELNQYGRNITTPKREVVERILNEQLTPWLMSLGPEERARLA